MELDIVKLKEIKPVIAGYIRDAQLLLKKSPVPDEKAVHDVRVLMKKARAVLKLLSPQVDDPFFERDAADLREVGRKLCSRRETSVQRKILKEFRKEYPEIFSELRDNEMLTQLFGKQESEQEPSEEIKIALEQIYSLLNNTAYRIRFQ